MQVWEEPNHSVMSIIITSAHRWMGKRTHKTKKKHDKTQHNISNKKEKRKKHKNKTINKKAKTIQS